MTTSPAAKTLAWGLFASPRARFPHPTARLLVTIVVHAAARLPVVRAVDPRGI